MGHMPKKATGNRLGKEVMWTAVRKTTESGFVKTTVVHIMTQHSPGARHEATEFSVSLMSFSSILV